MSIDSCPICGSTAQCEMLSIPRAPMSFLLTTNAEIPGFGSLRVVNCEVCGHVYNADFDHSALSTLYETGEITNVPVHPTMQKNVLATADYILSKAPAAQRIMEIGGGGGALSRVLAARTDAVTLVEPNRALTPDMFPETNLTLVADMFPSPRIKGLMDVIICRQVLEHVPVPRPFLAAIADALSDDGVAYIEVPNLEYLNRTAQPIDFHYPHVHYYRADVIAYLFAEVGLAVRERIEIKGGHDIGFIVHKASMFSGASLPVPQDSLADFGDRLATRIAAGRERLAGIDGKIGIYGICACSEVLLATYPGVAFSVGLDDTVAYWAYDTYGPQGRLPIRQPSQTTIANLDAVVITSYMHDKVIAANLRDIGFDGTILSVRCDTLAGQDGYPENLFATA